MLRSTASVVVAICSVLATSPFANLAEGEERGAIEGVTSQIQVARSLRGEVLVSASETHPLPLFIETVGNFLLVGGSGDTTFFVHDIATGRVLSVFGREGSGPGEFRNVGSLSLRREPGFSRSTIWAFDRALGRMTEIDLRVPRAPRLGQIVSGELAGQYSTFWLSPTSIVGVGAFTDKRLTLYDSTGKRVRSLGSLPLLDEGVPATVAHQALQPSTAVSATGHRLAVGARYSGQVDMYSMPEGMLSSARAPVPFRPRIDVGSNGAMLVFRTDRDTRFGYISMTSSADRVFALFSGRSRAQFPGRANYARELHVFDWNGRLIEVMRLDRDVFAIASNQEGNILYAISHDPDSEIVKFSTGARR